MKRLVVLALLSASIAHAEPSPAAKPHVDTGVAAYQSGDYKTAITEFEIAHGIDGDPIILYAWAQAHRLAGNCDKALELYRRYLDNKLTETQIATAKDVMKLCEQARVTPPPPPEPEPEPVRADPEAPPTGRSPWYKDALGGGLVIGGVASAAIGTTFFVLSNRSADAADRASSRREFLDHLDKATQRRRIGFAGVGVGAALVAAGVLRYVTRSDEPRRRVGVTASGGSLFVFGEF